MRHALCQVLKHGDEPSNCESSCPCYFSQIEGLGLHVVTITRYVVRIRKHLHNRIKITENQKAIIKIELNRKEYESLHPYSNAGDISIFLKHPRFLWWSAIISDVWNLRFVVLGMFSWVLMGDHFCLDTDIISSSLSCHKSKWCLGQTGICPDISGNSGTARWKRVKCLIAQDFPDHLESDLILLLWTGTWLKFANLKWKNKIHFISQGTSWYQDPVPYIVIFNNLG